MVVLSSRRFYGPPDFNSKAAFICSPGFGLWLWGVWRRRGRATGRAAGWSRVFLFLGAFAFLFSWKVGRRCWFGRCSRYRTFRIWCRLIRMAFLFLGFSCFWSYWFLIWAVFSSLFFPFFAFKTTLWTVCPVIYVFSTIYCVNQTDLGWNPKAWFVSYACLPGL